MYRSLCDPNSMETLNSMGTEGCSLTTEGAVTCRHLRVFDLLGSPVGASHLQVLTTFAPGTEGAYRCFAPATPFGCVATKGATLLRPAVSAYVECAPFFSQANIRSEAASRQLFFYFSFNCCTLRVQLWGSLGTNQLICRRELLDGVYINGHSTIV